MKCFDSLASINCRGFILGMLGLICVIPWAGAAEDYSVLRQRLVEQVSEDVIRTRGYAGKNTWMNA